MVSACGDLAVFHFARKLRNLYRGSAIHQNLSIAPKKRGMIFSSTDLGVLFLILKFAYLQSVPLEQKNVDPQRLSAKKIAETKFRPNFNMKTVSRCCISVLISVLRNRKALGKDTFLSFIDFQKAFDSDSKVAPRARASVQKGVLPPRGALTPDDTAEKKAAPGGVMTSPVHRAMRKRRER